jgi:hypothetical protein
LVIGTRSDVLLHLGHFIGNMGAVRPRTMNFGEWMVAQIPPEKQFLIEKQCRDIERHPEVGPLAAKLLKQCYHQQEMLQAAVNEIARLELLLMKD